MTLADKINSMIDRAVKSIAIVSPRFSDYRVDEILVTESPDLEAEIRDIVKKEAETQTKRLGQDSGVDPKTKKKIKDHDEKLMKYSSGNVEEISNMGSAAFGNVRSLAANPASFMFGAMAGKFTKGAGILFVAALAKEVVKFVINELYKPGRLFDNRFREQVDKQLIKFLTRKEQQQLKQGYKSVITTTVGGLRGNSLRGQIGGNFYNADNIPNHFIDPSWIREPSPIAANPQNASVGVILRTGGSAAYRLFGVWK